MRSPPVVPYIYALESAMDEQAVKLDMDPVALRRINDTMTEPVEGKAYSSRSLMTCYDQAAEAFGLLAASGTAATPASLPGQQASASSEAGTGNPTPVMFHGMLRQHGSTPR